MSTDVIRKRGRPKKTDIATIAEIHVPLHGTTKKGVGKKAVSRKKEELPKPAKSSPRSKSAEIVNPATSSESDGSIENAVAPRQTQNPIAKASPQEATPTSDNLNKPGANNQQKPQVEVNTSQVPSSEQPLTADVPPSPIPEPPINAPESEIRNPTSSSTSKILEALAEKQQQQRTQPVEIASNPSPALPTSALLSKDAPLSKPLKHVRTSVVQPSASPLSDAILHLQSAAAAVKPATAQDKFLPPEGVMMAKKAPIAPAATKPAAKPAISPADVNASVVKTLSSRYGKPAPRIDDGRIPKEYRGAARRYVLYSRRFFIRDFSCLGIAR